MNNPTDSSEQATSKTISTKRQHGVLTSGKTWLVLASLLGASGVALGAYHAHGLEKALVARGLEPNEVARLLNTCGIAVQFQMVHALALLAVGILAVFRESTLLSTSAVLMFLGTLLFSGGIYLHVLTGQQIHWSIVPLGGLAWIVGWLVLAADAIVRRKA